MKKSISIIAALLCVLFVLAGCGDKQEVENLTTENAGNYVTLGEYMGLKFSSDKSIVDEEQVKSYIEDLLEYYPAYENLDKTVVEDKDFVNIDFEGLLDGKAFDGGTAKGYILEIGSDSFIDGFEDGLIGSKVGDKVALNLTFPTEYSNAELAGKDVVFNVTVNAIVKILESTYEDVTDEYVKKYMISTEYETAQELKDDVRVYLEELNDYYAEQDARTVMLEEVMELCTIKELPKGLLDKRVKEYVEQYKKMVQEQYGMEFSVFLQLYSMTEETFTEDAVDYMQENLETELVLLAIANKEGIELDEEGYEKFIETIMLNYNYEKEEDFYADYDRAHMENSYICNKVQELLWENAEVTYVEVEDETETE